MRRVYIVPLHVKPMARSVMPRELAGAFVDCYALCADVEEATRKSLCALVEYGLLAESVLPPVREIELARWEVHVRERWPEHCGSLPAQAAFERAMRAGCVVHGPFAAYS